MPPIQLARALAKTLATPRRFRLWSGLHRQEDGQSLIETALILPVFFLMTFGFINLCLILFSMGNANFATRAAVRYASTHSTTSYFPATQQGFTNIVAPFIFQYPANTLGISYTYYTGTGQVGTNTVGNGVYVTLTISYPFSVLGHTYTPISFSTTGCGIVLQ